MRQTPCGGCGQLHPLGETFIAAGHVLCRSCAEAYASQHPDEVRVEGAVSRQMDPTVCAKCGADGGVMEYGRVFDVPFCSACEQFLRHRPFPAWVKLAAAAVAALVIVSLVRNGRFATGLVEARQASRLAKAGNYHEAAAKAESAAEHIPESEEIKALSLCFRGADLMNDEKSSEAVKVLSELKDLNPRFPHVEDALLQAEAAAAFDAKDYDTFLAKELESLKLRPNDPMARASVASAYACKYVQTGADDFKQKALEYLEKARSAPGAEAEGGLAEYEQRIRYRLASREIVTREEFKRRFPNGWREETK
jgi:tetratricopeptide (TPR) repeat protein